MWNTCRKGRLADRAAEGMTSRHALLIPVCTAHTEWLQEGSVRSMLAGGSPCPLYKTDYVLPHKWRQNCETLFLRWYQETWGKAEKWNTVIASSPRNIYLCCPCQCPQRPLQWSFSTGWGSVGAVIHKIWRVPGQVTGFSCCKSFLGYAEIYGCPSLMKMDEFSRLQVPLVSCQMSCSYLKYGREGGGG